MRYLYIFLFAVLLMGTAKADGVFKAKVNVLLIKSEMYKMELETALGTPSLTDVDQLTKKMLEYEDALKEVSNSLDKVPWCKKDIECKYNIEMAHKNMQMISYLMKKHLEQGS